MHEVATYHEPNRLPGAPPPSGLLRLLMRIEDRVRWHAPDMDDLRDLLRHITRTEEKVDAEIDALILRICPELADGPMPFIHRHGPDRFGGVTDDEGLVIVKVERTGGTLMLTFTRSVMSRVPRSAELTARVARAQQAHPDVTFQLEGIFSRAVAVEVTIPEGEATLQGMEGVIRRLGEAARAVAPAEDRGSPA
jgi:hypothetical protein